MKYNCDTLNCKFSFLIPLLQIDIVDYGILPQIYRHTLKYDIRLKYKPSALSYASKLIENKSFLDVIQSHLREGHLRNP